MNRENKYPRISIVTPSYNQGQFLERTINSVLNQQYPNLEYFIIDGGSTDESVDIIKKYENKITNWVSEPDNGQSHAINKGWQLGNGDIIAWINSDDYYLPGVFDIVAKKFINNIDLIAVIGDCKIVDGRGRETRKEIKGAKFDFDSILAGGDIPGQPAVFLSSKVLKTVGYLDEGLYYTMDWEYWLRIATKYSLSEFSVINQPLATFNIWEGGKTESAVGLDLAEKREFYSSFFADDDNQEFQKYKRISFGSTYWRQGRRQLESKQIISSIISYIRAFIFHPIKFNFIKGIYKNLDLIIPERIRNSLNKLR